MNRIKTYIEKFKKARKLANTNRVKQEANQFFDIINVANKPVLTFHGIVITIPGECSSQILLDKLFKLRELYIKNKKDLIENNLW